MNIYIYGNQGFKKEIHQTLEHANIKFKIGSDSIIKDIISLDELKQTIKNNPDDIYLIDDEKIIKKNSINKKIKFLTPKDGIEQEFLKENRIGEASVNSLAELPKYILRKYTELKSVDSEIQQSIIGIVDKAYEDNLTDEEEEIVLDEELSMLLSKNNDMDKLEQNDTFIDKEDDVLIENNNDESYTKEIETSFTPTPIVDELENMLDNMEDLKVEQVSPEKLNSIEDFNEDVGLNNITFDYDHGDSTNDIDDDFLKQLESTEISNDDFKEEKNLEFNGNIDDFLNDLEITTSSVKSIEDIENNSSEYYIEEKFDLEEDIKFEENIEIPIVKNDTIEKISKGEDNMIDEFSQLDSLSEKDILEALENISTPQVTEKEIKKSNSQLETIPNNISISTSDSQDLMSLLTKLLNNKTLEITIKIKD